MPAAPHGSPIALSKRMHPDALAHAGSPLSQRSPHLLDASVFWAPIGGVRRVLSAKHAWLSGHGWRHTVLAPGARGEGQIDCGGLILPASGGYRVMLDRRRAERLIEQARPDIVEVADPYTLAWAVLGVTARLGLPAVAFCHSDLPSLAARLLGGADGLNTRRGRWAAQRAQAYLVGLYSRFDLVLAPSQALAARLRGWGLSQVRVQPLGVDCSVFTPAACDLATRAQLCRQLGLGPAVRLLVYSGRFAPEKNLHVLAEAVRLLGPGHALLAVGSGPCPPRGPGVHVLPPPGDDHRLAALLASCDTYVHAGDQETFGLGVLEAMACGAPLVVSARAGLGELAHGVGLTVAGRNPREWAEAIRASLAAGTSALTVAALLRSRQHEWNTVLEQLGQRYLNLLGQHAGPPVHAHEGPVESRTPGAAQQRPGEPSIAKVTHPP
jgi:alpha-1,6-mannosyltransferase